MRTSSLNKGAHCRGAWNFKKYCKSWRSGLSGRTNRRI